MFQPNARIHGMENFKILKHYFLMHPSLTDLHKTKAYITLTLPLNTTVLKGLTVYTKRIKLMHSRGVVSFHPKIKFYFGTLWSMIATIDRSLSVPYPGL